MRTATAPADGRFAALGAAPTVLLTTYGRDGRPVRTPVNVVWAGDRGWFETWDSAAKLDRIWRDPAVELAPCTFRGRPTGPTVAARARILTGGEAEDARRRLARRFPFLHGRLVPALQRRRGWTTVHLELLPR